MSWKIHDYRCTKCGHEFEEMVAGDGGWVPCRNLLDDGETVCDGQADRIMSAASVHTMETRTRGYAQDGKGRWRKK